MKARIVVMLTIAVVWVTTPAYAATVQFQQGAANQYAPSGYIGAEDTDVLYHSYSHIDEPHVQETTGNYGASEYIKVGLYEMVEAQHYSQLDVAFGLLRFGLDGISLPSVTSARLRLFAVGDHPEQLKAASMFSQDRAWVAGTADGIAQNGSACWAQRSFGSANWYNTPGTNYEMTSPWQNGYNITFSSTGNTWTPDGGSTVYREVIADIPVQTLLSWCGASNGGLRLYNNFMLSIASSDCSYQDLRPALVLETVPEPSSVVALLLGLASAGMIRVRRR